MLNRIQLGKEESQGTSTSCGIEATGGRGLPEEGGTQCDSGPVILVSVAGPAEVLEKSPGHHSPAAGISPKL